MSTRADRPSASALTLEQFVQALTAQLDRAQDALAMKARSGRPLTFALRDMAVDLHVFWEVGNDGVLRIRNAGPNETGASLVKLSFTSITREMVEENTIAFQSDDDPRGLGELGGSLSPEQRRQLDLAGVRTVGQLKRLSSGASPVEVEAYLGIPVMRLQAALRSAAQPAVLAHEVIEEPDGRTLLRIQGVNLAGKERPEVRLRGEPVEVVEAHPNELLVRPLSHHREGQIEVRIGSAMATGFFYTGEGREPAPTAATVDPWSMSAGGGR